ncbi:MAG: hypothetical protein RBS82_05600 [Syntrophales bacterium]|jgi:hypothetical protein|nr:hypothetical protein [Syntrophales bacterium]
MPFTDDFFWVKGGDREAIVPRSFLAELEKLCGAGIKGKRRFGILARDVYDRFWDIGIQGVRKFFRKQRKETFK